MPKIIENLEARLIAEARRQTSEDGYAAMTIRSVAKGCGVGVGTVYNYFPSKDDLTAAFMLEDWQACINVITAVSTYADTPKPVVLCIYDQLRTYGQQHQGIFRDETALSAFAGSFSKYHSVLRSQLAQPLRKYCSDDFSAGFIAEALLTWTMAGTDLDVLYSKISPLFKE